MPLRRLPFVLACLALLCCRDEVGSDTGGGTSTVGADDAGPTTAASADSAASADDSASTSGPGDCVAGQQDCACLANECSGSLECIEGVCLPGPELELPASRNVLAGLRVPLQAEILADSFTWSQIAGPEVELLQAETSEPLVDIPADVPAGSIITLRLEAERNTIVTTADVSLTIVAPVLETFATDASGEQLGTTEGLDMEGNNMWVVSANADAGFVSRFDPQGTFLNRFDIPGTPVGARIGRLAEMDVLLVGNAGLSAVQTLDLETGAVATLTNEVTGGGSLGPVNFVLPGDGRLFFTNRAGGQVFVYDVETQTTRLFVEGLGSNPNSIAFGPEPNVLYVGTWGQIHRVPIVDGDDGPTAGQSSVYLDFGPTTDLSHEVDGLTFDEGGNLWVGSPNNRTLYVAPYVADGATQVRWSLSPEAGTVGRFVNLRFGRDGFDRYSVYYTNLEPTVGRLYVGVEGD